MNYPINLQNYLPLAKSIGVVFGVFLVFKVTKLVLLRYIKKATEKTKTALDDVFIERLTHLPNYFLLTLSLWAASFFLDLPQKVDRLLYSAFIIALGIEIAKLTSQAVQTLIKEFAQKHKKINETLLLFLSRISRILIWAIIILLILQNLGYNITTLIAGLGIGGIAVAFALQNILSDIFASFSIFFDRPFEIGDYIVVGQNRGTVKKIGIKTTRIESVEGQEVIIPNKELTETVLHNYGRIKYRRIAFSLGIRYETPNKKVVKAKKIIEEAIKQAPNVERLDRVYFKTFGDFALIFEIVYFMNTSDYKTYLETQEKINLKIKEEFEKEGIEFAYPTQTVILEKAQSNLQSV